MCACMCVCVTALPCSGRTGIVEARALDCCARKCAGLTGGDFRRCLDLCRCGADGHGFNEHKKFSKLRDDLCVITVNHAARFWEADHLPNFFVINHKRENSFI